MTHTESVDSSTLAWQSGSISGLDTSVDLMATVNEAWLKLEEMVCEDPHDWPHGTPCGNCGEGE